MHVDLKECFRIENEFLGHFTEEMELDPDITLNICSVYISLIFEITIIT